MIANIGRSRVRGYQSSQTGPKPEKLNKAPFKKLGDSKDKSSTARDAGPLKNRALDEGKEKVAESDETQPLAPNADAKDLEDSGFAKLYE